MPLKCFLLNITLQDLPKKCGKMRIAYFPPPLPTVSGSPTASERGTKSEVAHLWARWLLNPCRLGEPLRFRAGGLNQKWPTRGRGGYLTPAVPGSPSASERGTKSEAAHLWARWLHCAF